jgi:hypothetical protein
MPASFTPEQVRRIRDAASQAFAEVLTEEEVAALGHPNPIKCYSCKIGLYIAAGELIAAALVVGLANLDEEAELVEVLADFAHVSKEIIDEWLKEAADDKLSSVKSVVHFLCKKMHACK